MPIVHYEYEKSKIVQDSAEVPQQVIDRGEAAIRNFILEIVWSMDYAFGSDSEDEEVTFNVDGAK